MSVQVFFFSVNIFVHRHLFASLSSSLRREQNLGRTLRRSLCYQLRTGDSVCSTAVCGDSATCSSDVVGPISTNPLIVTHKYRKRNRRFSVYVEGSDVIGACADPSLAIYRQLCRAEMSVTVSASDCSHPSVFIVDQAPVFTSPRLNHRSVQLVLQAVIDFQCRTTLRNTKVR